MDAVLLVAVGLIATFAVFSVGALWGYEIGRNSRKLRQKHVERD
jgi:hypothetical protein